MLNPVPEKDERHVPGCRREDICDHGLCLVQRLAEGKYPFCELSWKVKVIT